MKLNNLCKCCKQYIIHRSRKAIYCKNCYRFIETLQNKFKARIYRLNQKVKKLEFHKYNIVVRKNEN